jgi:hypothetical protein
MSVQLSIWSRLVGSLIAMFALLNGAAYAQPLPSGRLDAFSAHPRVFVVSDIGNEADDQMSFVRLLLYSNEIDLEGLVATTSTWQKAVTHPETMHEIIAKYGEVRANLLKHASGWPTAAEFDQMVSVGQPAYGMPPWGLGSLHPGRRLWSRPRIGTTRDRCGSRSGAAPILWRRP